MSLRLERACQFCFLLSFAGVARADWQVLQPNAPLADLASVPSVAVTPLPTVVTNAPLRLRAGGATPRFSLPQALPVASGERIRELARGLDFDWRRCYRFVHDHIAFTPVRGILRGPERTLLDREGSDADQALLLCALLEACGVDAEPVYAPAREPSADGTVGFALPLWNQGGLFPYNAVSWLGLRQEGSAADLYRAVVSCFSSVGRPVWVYRNPCIDGSPYFLATDHFWVRAMVGGITWQLNPSVKPMSSCVPRDPLSDSLYARTSLLSAAGGVVSADGVSGLSAAGARDFLNDAASVLSSAWTNANSSAVAFVGGSEIVRHDGGDVFFHGDFSVNPLLPSEDGNDFLNAFRARVTVALGTVSGSFFLDELAARRLWISFENASSAFPRAVIRLDDDVVLSEPAGSVSPDLTLGISVALTNANTTAAYPLERNVANVYVLSAGLGGHARNGVCAVVSEDLAAARLDGTSDDSAATLSRSLHLLGQEWLAQGAMLQRFARTARLGGPIPIYSLGLAGQHRAPFVDFRNVVVCSSSNGGGEPLTLFLSALEHAVPDQLNGAGAPSVSTVRLLELAAETDTPVRFADASNAMSVYRMLSGYAESDRSDIQERLLSGWSLVLPERGDLTSGSWTGCGYAGVCRTDARTKVGLMISGGLNGGYCTEELVPSSLLYIDQTAAERFADGSVAPSTGADPVALPSGAFLDERTDLSVPGGTTLNWTRRYDSRARLDPGPLGCGWTHGFDASVTETFDADAVFGGGSVAAAVPTALALSVVRDLLTDIDGLSAGEKARRWTVAALVVGWWTHQHVGASATVRLGAQTIRFQRRPDGAYAAAPGVTAALTKASDGKWLLRERNGNLYAFRSDGRLEAVTDPSGNVTRLAYSNGRLTGVANAFGASLALTWSGERISRVADGCGRSVSYDYGADGCLTSVTDVGGQSWRASYDPVSHALVSKTDPDGRVTVANRFNAFAQVTNQTVGSSGPWTFGYVNEVEAWERDPSGALRRETYDVAGRVLERENPDGGDESYLYDGHGHLIASRDARGCIVTNVWDARDNLVFTDVRQLPRPTSFAYDAADRLVSVTNALGGISGFAYDGCGRLIAKVLPDGTRKTFSWTAAGLLAYDRIDSAAGVRLREVRSAYDAVTGLRTSRTICGPGLPSGGATESFAYDTARRLAAWTDANGHQSSWQYLADGNMETNFHPDGTFTRFSYTPAGRPHQAWDASGRCLWSRRWTPSGRLASTTFADGSVVTNVYDASDRLIRTVDERGGWEDRSYDLLGRLQSSSTPAGTASWHYSRGGLLTNAVDAAGVSERYWYDWHGNRTMVSNAVASVWTSGYDALGRRTRMTDPLGHVRRTRFDAVGRRTAAVRPSGATESFVSDGLGRLVAVTNAEGHVLSQVYDACGNLTSVTNALGICVLAATYDGGGNRRSQLDANGALTTFAYDAADRLVSRMADDGTDVFTYDVHGNLVAASNAVASATFSYDLRDRLVASSGRIGNASFATAWSRDVGGLVTNLDYGTGFSVSRAYDLAGRLVRICDSHGHVWTFSWDGASRPLGGTAPDGTVHALAYDAAGRLTSWSAGSLAGRTIVRDAAGRRIRDTVTAGPMPCAALRRRAENTFDAADRLVSASVTYSITNRPVRETFAYDLAGALTNATRRLPSGESASFFAATYDAQGRLASLGGGADAPPVAFAYDALGNRVRVGDRLFVPDHDDPLKRPLLECDADGTVIRHYLWGPTGLLGFVDASGTLTVAHADEQGSVIALTTPEGAILFRATYGPHGEDWGTSGANPTPFAWLGGLGVMRFAPSLVTDDSALYTPHSALYLTRHRLYSPVLQRFLSADPLGMEGGLNLYAYANGDPLAYVDPLGLCAEDWDALTRIGGFFQMLGGSAEAAAGYAFAAGTAETGVGIAAGVAVGMHGTDVAYAGYRTMTDGAAYDTLTSQGLQAAGVPRGWANGIDAGASAVGSAGVGMVARGVLRTSGTAVQMYYPPSGGAIGNETYTYLYKGTLIDRYGGGNNSRYFSPIGTPAEMRAMPQHSNDGVLRTFRVEKPFAVEQSVVAPAFDQLGLGIQYKTPVKLGVMLEHGILREVR